MPPRDVADLQPSGAAQKNESVLHHRRPEWTERGAAEAEGGGGTNLWRSPLSTSITAKGHLLFVLFQNETKLGGQSAHLSF